MTKFWIPVVWQMAGSYIVEANSLKEAEQLVVNPQTPMPADECYIDNSMELDKEHPDYGEVIS